jgi:hypothetical protein
VTIYSPETGISPSRSINLNVGVTEIVKTLEYSLDDGRFTRLCSNCDIYNRKKTFRNGDHKIVVRATDYAGNKNEAEVSFKVIS